MDLRRLEFGSGGVCSDSLRRVRGAAIRRTTSDRDRLRRRHGDGRRHREVTAGTGWRSGGTGGGGPRADRRMSPCGWQLWRGSRGSDGGDRGQQAFPKVATAEPPTSASRATRSRSRRSPTSPDLSPVCSSRRIRPCRLWSPTSTARAGSTGANLKVDLIDDQTTSGGNRAATIEACREGVRDGRFDVGLRRRRGRGGRGVRDPGPLRHPDEPEPSRVPATSSPLIRTGPTTTSSALRNTSSRSTPRQRRMRRSSGSTLRSPDRRRSDA